MEPEDSIDYLRMSANKVCLLKEAPVRRWLARQQEWDKRFEGSAKRVVHRRKKYERKYNIAILRAVELGIVVVKEDGTGVSSKLTDVRSVDFVSGSKSKSERWGPFDLENENPPPSAIAGRRDNVRDPPSQFWHEVNLNILSLARFSRFVDERNKQTCAKENRRKASSEAVSVYYFLASVDVRPNDEINIADNQGSRLQNSSTTCMFSRCMVLGSGLCS